MRPLLEKLFEFLNNSLKEAERNTRKYRNFTIRIKLLLILPHKFYSFIK